MAILKDDKILDQLEGKKDIAIALVIFAIFSIFAVFIFQSESPTTQDIPDYNKLIKNPFEDYDKMMEKANVKKLVENEQYREMKYNTYLHKFIQEDNSPQTNEDPFDSSFK